MSNIRNCTRLGFKELLKTAKDRDHFAIVMANPHNGGGRQTKRVWRKPMSIFVDYFKTSQIEISIYLLLVVVSFISKIFIGVHNGSLMGTFQFKAHKNKFQDGSIIY